MSIPFSGTFRRSGGVVSAIGKQLRAVNLKAAKRITVKFDPFGDNVTHTRNFLHYISSQKISLTNPNCTLKTEVVCDRREPTVEITLVPSIAEFCSRIGLAVLPAKQGVQNLAEHIKLNLECNNSIAGASSNVKKVSVNSGNLTCLEILQLLNKHISSLAPVEEPVSSIQTKSEKKKTKRR